MKFKKFMALGLVAAMTATLFAGCGSKGNDSADATQKSDSASADGLVSYSDIVLGETGKDLSATITMFNHRTDMDTDDYGGADRKGTGKTAERTGNLIWKTSTKSIQTSRLKSQQIRTMPMMH